MITLSDSYYDPHFIVKKTRAQRLNTISHPASKYELRSKHTTRQFLEVSSQPLFFPFQSSRLLMFFSDQIYTCPFSDFQFPARLEFVWPGILIPWWKVPRTFLIEKNPLPAALECFFLSFHKYLWNPSQALKFPKHNLYKYYSGPGNNSIWYWDATSRLQMKHELTLPCLRDLR